jgi:formate hydrogenlyase subunit 6/NADH:ubiquinone oxidoreductase subunit I
VGAIDEESLGEIARMPFQKTEVDVHTDYVVEAVDPEWLAKGVRSPKHLMLDPDNCILCRACEDVCPWNCIFMMAPDIVQDVPNEAVLDLRRRRQRVHQVLGVRRAVPDRHVVLRASSRGHGRTPHHGRRTRIPAGRGRVA